MTSHKSHSKQYVRLLKLLMKAGREGLPVELGNSKAIATFKGRTYSFAEAVFSKATADNAITYIENAGNNGKQISITDIGKIIARKLLHPELEFQNPQQEWVTSSKDEVGVKNVGGSSTFIRNLSESPLMRLYTRKDKNGQAYLTDEELAAGEKLRTDFERANLQPSVTANLQSFISGNSGGNIGNQYAAMTDFAIDNRAYVEKAVASLGPELSGIALDICCFLKGLELVERERRWPPRSAKLMLKTALSILARHYGFSQNYSRAAGKIEHWGGDGYRPDINAG